MACDPVESYASPQTFFPEFHSFKLVPRKPLGDSCVPVRDYYGLRDRPFVFDQTPARGVEKLFSNRPVNLPSLESVLNDLLKLKGIDDFRLTATIKVPVVDFSEPARIVQTISRADIANKGVITMLGIEFKPSLGPIPLQKTLNQFPLLGPFFRIKVLRLFMDPQTRRIQTRVEYLIFPFKKDIHDLVVEKAGIPDLKRGLPVPIHQMVELVQKTMKEKGEEGIRKLTREIGIDKMIPLFEDGQIQVEGNFSNERIQFTGLGIQFSPLPMGQKHRLTVTGNLLKPVIKVWGLKSLEVQHPRALLRVVNDESLSQSPNRPLEIHAAIDPSGQKPVSFTIPKYQTSRAFIESEPYEGSDFKFRLNLEEGLDLADFRVELGPGTPLFSIRRLVAKRTSFDGFGIKLQTTPGGEAIFEDSQLRVIRGKAYFTSKITGKSTGEIRLSSPQEEIGFLKFDSLGGTGHLIVGRDDLGQEQIQIFGNVQAKFPELRLLVRFNNIKAFVRTTITNATLRGRGRLTVMPKLRMATLRSVNSDEPVLIRGQGGQVNFHQDLSEVAHWPDLKRHLGSLSSRVVTDLTMDLKEIEFGAHEMTVTGNTNLSGGKNALEISKADLGPIKILGDVRGRFFLRLPGGFYQVFEVGQTSQGAKKGIYDAVMKNAAIEVDRLIDQKDAKGQREVTVRGLKLSGVESQPTFSKRDQKRCGTDRTHIHAQIGLFQFSPNDRRIRVEQIAPHFHLYLRNRLMGGCLKVD